LGDTVDRAQKYWMNAATMTSPACRYFFLLAKRYQVQRSVGIRATVCNEIRVPVRDCSKTGDAVRQWPEADGAAEDGGG